jgi:hypothetical protein
MNKNIFINSKINNINLETKTKYIILNFEDIIIKLIDKINSLNIHKSHINMFKKEYYDFYFKLLNYDYVIINFNNENIKLNYQYEIDYFLNYIKNNKSSIIINIQIARIST